MKTEQELARLCTAGDREAQGELYALYASRLYALCYRYIADRDEAQDLMHDAMIKAMGSFKSFSYTGEGSLYAWLRRLTVNVAIDRLRQMSKLRMVPIDQAMEPGNTDDEDQDADNIPAQALLDMVAALPSVRRTVFNMYCIDGFSHKDIAGAIGITEKGSASILAKARTQLKSAVNNYLKRTGR